MHDRAFIDHNPIFLREIHIENFKGIEKLDITFPQPSMRNDLDVIVLGSQNGIGKTSVLEACSLLYLVAMSDDDMFIQLIELFQRGDLTEYFIRAGHSEAIISGVFETTGQKIDSQITINRDEGLIYTDSLGSEGLLLHFPDINQPKLRHNNYDMDQLIDSLLGKISNPMAFYNILYFHSDRKVRAGTLSLSNLFDVEVKHNQSEESLRRYDNVQSEFKLVILKAMMSRRGLFENINTDVYKDTIEALNQIVLEFSGGVIEKLRSTRDNSLEIRVTSNNGKDSISFDGLSSGQKEIISTLFMIWHNTKDTPGIVLIDEPELHLNAEWHRKFIRHLHKLAPQNQYIIATHSEEVFASVDEDRRLLLVNEHGGESDEG